MKKYALFLVSCLNLVAFCNLSYADWEDELLEKLFATAPTEAQGMIQSFRSNFTGIKDFKEKLKEATLKNGYPKAPVL